MRTSFIKELVAQARQNPRIFLVVGDLGFSVVEPFATEFPDRFINAGVAEQNMTGLAAGLASEGYHVFTYSIANFPTFRCAEQIRNDIVYHKLAVTVVAVGAGYAYGALGYSHHAIQDIALMRAFGDVLIATPGTATETAAAVRYLVSHPGPSYLRLGKSSNIEITPPMARLVANRPFYINPAAARKSRLVLTIGGALRYADEAVSDSATSRWEVATLPLWCHEGASDLARALSVHKTILTVEDHISIGGLGEFVSGVLSKHEIPAKCLHACIEPLAAPAVGSLPYLDKLAGLSPSKLRKLMSSESTPDVD